MTKTNSKYKQKIQINQNNTEVSASVLKNCRIWFISWLRSDQIWRCERCLFVFYPRAPRLASTLRNERRIGSCAVVSKRASHLQNPAESVDESAARGKRAVSRSLKLCIVWSLCSGSRQILYIDPSNFSLSHFLACGWVWTRSSGKCRSILER